MIVRRALRPLSDRFERPPGSERASILDRLGLERRRRRVDGAKSVTQPAPLPNIRTEASVVVARQESTGRFGSDRLQPGGLHDPYRRAQVEQQTLEPGPLADRQDHPPRAVRPLLGLLGGIALHHPCRPGIATEHARIVGPRV